MSNFLITQNTNVLGTHARSVGTYVMMKIKIQKFKDWRVPRHISKTSPKYLVARTLTPVRYMALYS